MKISVAVRTKFHAFQLAQQLQNRGALATLYTSFYGKILGKSNKIGFSIQPDKVRQNYLTALLFYGFNLHKFPIYQYFGEWTAKQLKEEDLVVMFPMIALPILQKSKSLGIKTVISHASAHTIEHKNLLIEAYQQAGLSTKFLEEEFSNRRQDTVQEEYAMADFIQVPSTFVEQTFLANGIPAHKLKVIPLGVDLRFFYRENISLPKKFRLIYVGQLSVQKGLPTLLRAFEELNLPDVELCLVGALLPEIKNILAKNNKNINYLGILPQNKLINEFQRSSVFVIHSVQDGFAQVVPQAMACGLPVICSANVGGADLVIDGKTGFVTPIYAVEKLKEKILYFYQNPQEIIRMGYEAQQKVENNYTWDIFGQNSYDFYQTILANK
jgi:glycosyltransferase involved in cell wall biosynthesis